MHVAFILYMQNFKDSSIHIPLKLLDYTKKIVLKKSTILKACYSLFYFILKENWEQSATTTPLCSKLLQLLQITFKLYSQEIL